MHPVRIPEHEQASDSDGAGADHLQKVILDQEIDPRLHIQSHSRRADELPYLLTSSARQPLPIGSKNLFFFFKFLKIRGAIMCLQLVEGRFS